MHWMRAAERMVVADEETQKAPGSGKAYNCSGPRDASSISNDD